MIEIDLSLWKDLPAVLATVAVAVEDVAPRESHFPRGQTIVAHQLDHLGDPDGARRSADHLVLGPGRQITPVLEVVTAEVRRDGISGGPE